MGAGTWQGLIIMQCAVHELRGSGILWQLPHAKHVFLAGLELLMGCAV